jgi:hypothetical protein
MSYIDKENYNIYIDIEDIRIKSPLFEVDDLIAPVISMLNKKGYITTFCCSGHCDNSPITKGFTIKHDNCYISFQDLEIHKKIKTLPDKFKWEIDENSSIIRNDYDFIEKDYIYNQTVINTTMIKLYEWVLKLEDLKGN